MYWAVSNVADRKELGGAVQDERLYRQKGAGTRKLLYSQKVAWF